MLVFENWDKGRGLLRVAWSLQYLVTVTFSQWRAKFLTSISFFEFLVHFLFHSQGGKETR